MESPTSQNRIIGEPVLQFKSARIATEYSTGNTKEVWDILSDLMVELFDLPKEDVNPEMPLAHSA